MRTTIAAFAFILPALALAGCFRSEKPVIGLWGDQIILSSKKMTCVGIDNEGKKVTFGPSIVRELVKGRDKRYQYLVKGVGEPDKAAGRYSVKEIYKDVYILQQVFSGMGDWKYGIIYLHRTSERTVRISGVQMRDREIDPNIVRLAQKYRVLLKMGRYVPRISGSRANMQSFLKELYRRKTTKITIECTFK